MRMRFALGILSLFALVGLGAESASPSDKSLEASKNDINGDALPEGAVARIGTGRLRCGAFGRALLGFSPDAKRFISVGAGWIYHWDAATGRLLRRVHGHDGAEKNGFNLRQSALSADTTTAAFWTVAAIRIWDTTSGQERRAIPWELKGDESFLQLALSTDGSLLAVTPDLSPHDDVKGNSYPISLWDTHTGERRYVLSGHPAAITALAFSHDGRTLLSIGNDHAVCAWDVASGRRRFRIETSKDETLASVAVAADDKTLAICSHRYRAQKAEHPFVLRDLNDGLLIHRLRSEPADIEAAAFSPDGRLLALFEGNNAEGKAVSVYDLKSGERLRRIQGPRGRHIEHLTFAPDSKKLAGCASGSLPIYLWDVAAGRELAMPAGHHNLVSSLVFTNHGSTVLTHSYDRTLKLWDARTGALQALPAEKTDGVDKIVASLDRKSIASLEDFNHVRLWDADSGRMLHSVTIDLPRRAGKNSPPLQVLGLALASQNKTLVTIAYNPQTNREFETSTWDTATGKLMHAWKTGGDESVLFSPDGRLAVSPGGVVREAISGQVLCQLPPLDQRGASYALAGVAVPAAFSRDGRLLAAVGVRAPYRPGELQHHIVQMWEIASCQLVFAIDVPEDIDECVALSNDGSILVSAGSGGIVVWDTATGRRLLERRDLNGYVATLTLSPDETRLATAMADTSVLIWDVSSAVRARQAMHLGSHGDKPRVLERLWSDLASVDAHRGQAAVWALVGARERSTAWLADHLHAAEAVAADRLRNLVAQLDSPRFAEREQAFQELRKLDRQAEAALRRALDAKPSPETRARIESLLGELRSERAPERLREIRALQALEAMAMPQAIEVLKRLAKGAAGARLTQDAQESVERVLASAK